MLIEGRLQDRGYFVLLVGRAGFVGPPPGANVFILGNYKVSYADIIARL